MQKKIIVIDDEELVLKSLKRVLEKSGYQVLAFKSGSEAIEHIKQHSDDFDLVISDVRMPNLDGVDTIKEMRRICSGKKQRLVPEILITGYADDQLTQRSIELKVADYMYKPFDMIHLLNKIKTLLP